MSGPTATALDRDRTELALRSGEAALRAALVDSRQRWRDLVHLATDLSFETDADGAFTLIAPDPALGWPPAALLGQSSRLLLPPAGADADAGVMPNPFEATAAPRRLKAWVQRADGRTAFLCFSTAPLRDAEGHIIGVRGIAIDMTDTEELDTRIGAALRRADLIDHILWRMRQEVLAPKMMGAVLDTARHALGAEGAAVLVMLDDQSPPTLRHALGASVGALLPAIGDLARQTDQHALAALAPDGRRLLLSASATRFGERAVTVFWRPADALDWDQEDDTLVSSVTGIVRVVLEHESIQREMVRQARTDPLTTLLNRTAFLQEVNRRIERLQREAEPGVLLFVDLDNFKRLNDTLGHEAGDLALRATAAVLRKAVRPADLIARMGGDEFALWLDGADQFTAAERAEALRTEGTRELNLAVDAPPSLQLGMSIGIAPRVPGACEDLDTLIRRADEAMYEVKRSGRGHWRVARPTVG